MAIEPGDAARVRQRRSRQGVAAPHHQHLFNARLDFDVDGADQRGLRGRRRARAARARQPVGQRVPASGRPGSRREPQAQRDDRRGAQPRRGGSSNPNVRNGLGQPVALQAGARRCRRRRCSPHPDSTDRQARRRSRSHNLWVTPYAPDERRAAGEYPNQHAGGDGLPALDRGRPLARRHRHRASGTRSASRTSCGPRTGRSCRSSTRGFLLIAVRLLRPQPRARRPADVGRAAAATRED